MIAEGRGRDRMTRKEHGVGDGAAVYLDCSGGYETVCVCQAHRIRETELYCV